MSALKLFKVQGVAAFRGANRLGYRPSPLALPPTAAAVGYLIPQKPTPKEQLRSGQRVIGRDVRDLERELAVLKREEAKLTKVGRLCACCNYWCPVLLLRL